MLFTSTLFQTYIKKVRLTVHEAVAASCFLCLRLPPEVHFLQSHQLPYLSPHHFRHSVYFLYILHCCCFAQFRAAFHPQNMFHQQLCVNSGAVSLTLHHNIRHITHKNGTLYLYRTKDSAKLTVHNPQSCLLWKTGSSLNTYH